VRRNITLIIIISLLLFIYFFFLKETQSKIIIENTWIGYKNFFIDNNGRVIRIDKKDTVSEGQAYAMLRAVWMNDRDTFDRCYLWAENNLSRKKITGDNLLAWHWKDGKILDRMPAADADIDYALSLIFAGSIWKDPVLKGNEDYSEKAKKILNDILNYETHYTAEKRLYLLPWIITDGPSFSCIPINPSYYSPAHFRIFYQYTKDKRWLELIDTTYFILNSLLKNFNNKKGVGLVPDWCCVNKEGNFYPLEGKNCGFGWEAVRIPLRVGMDYLWFKNKDARIFLKNSFSAFIEKQWQKDKILFSEYDYSGSPIKKYENPLFYAAYFCSLYVSGSDYRKEFLNKVRSYLSKKTKGWVYIDESEYFVNSLAWFTEGFNSGVIKNLFEGQTTKCMNKGEVIK
jgi:endoglucanase